MSQHARPLNKDQTLKAQYEFDRQLGPQDADVYQGFTSGLELLLRGVLVTVDAKNGRISKNKVQARSLFAPVGEKGFLVSVPGPIDGPTLRRLERGLRALGRALRWRAKGRDTKLSAKLTITH